MELTKDQLNNADAADALPLSRSPGPDWQDLLAADSREVPEFLHAQSPYLNGLSDIPKARYLSREFHELEKERLWSRVWQFACREEHLPAVGSYIVYDIADQSYLVTRVTESQIKAYPNACLHRGRLLKTYDGRCSEFRCPYHGFSWHLDGELKQIPAEWDFPQLEVRSEDMTLPEVKVGTWAGFVFINPEPDAEPLEDFLGPEIQRHFDRWDFENRYVAAHASRVIRCNWKIANEAFSEGFHVNATHPQGMSYTGDPSSQVDVWGNATRQLSPKGIPCPLLKYTPTQEEMLRDALDVRDGEQLPVPFEEGDTLRSVLSAAGRERFRPTFGDGVDELTDAEFLDAWNYLVFPNFHPWGAFNRIVYRFR
ncbi:MAG: aromatic ring-hydroxylating oxygenase subunit alpha, partial [Acidimicrobiales bacterium]